MPTATASVATERPAPYMNQLCEHFGRRDDLAVTWDR